MSRRVVIPFLATGIVFVLAATGLGNLTSGSWYLDHSNTLPDGMNYGKVTIEADSTVGAVKFTVEAFNVQPAYGSLNKFGLDDFSFNFANLTSSPSAWTIQLPANWSQKNNGGNKSDFGRFQVSEGTNGANYRLATLSFTITLPTFEEAIASNFAVPSIGGSEGNSFFVAHVAGFSSSNPTATSHWIGGSTPTVPAPGAIALGMFGLGLVGWIKRRFA